MSFSELLAQVQQDQLVYWGLPLYLVASLLENWYARRQNKALHVKSDTIASLWMMFLVGFVDFLPKLLGFYLFFQLHELSPLKDVVARQWWAWALLLFCDDFIYYWFHRANHEVRLFWAGHVNHHSAIRMHYVTALRQGLGERLHKYFFWLPLPLLGFDPMMIVTVMGINLFYQFWIHTELVDKLPKPIETIFNTPSHHRVHHGSNIRYLDCNHGGMLIIWDRLFGTFAQEVDSDPVKYGLTENLANHHPWHVASHEYKSIWHDIKRAPTWREKLKYLFYAPGWSHDGTDKRAKVLRAKLATQD